MLTLKRSLGVVEGEYQSVMMTPPRVGREQRHEGDRVEGGAPQQAVDADAPAAGPVAGRGLVAAEEAARAEMLVGSS